MSEKFKRIYKDLLNADLSKTYICDTVFGYEISFPDIQIELNRSFFFRTEVKIKMRMDPGQNPPYPFITKFTFKVFGRKLYNRVKKIYEQKLLKEKQKIIDQALEILDNPKS